MTFTESRENDLKFIRVCQRVQLAHKIALSGGLISASGRSPILRTRPRLTRRLRSRLAREHGRLVARLMARTRNDFQGAGIVLSMFFYLGFLHAFGDCGGGLVPSRTTTGSFWPVLWAVFKSEIDRVSGLNMNKIRNQRHGRVVEREHENRPSGS